jgi:hypothetical protein
MRIITSLFFLLLFSVSVFALDDLTPDSTGTTTIPIQQNNQFSLIQTKLSTLESKVDSIQANSMTADDFHTFSAELKGIVNNFGIDLLQKIIIVVFIVSTLFKAIELLLKKKGMI